MKSVGDWSATFRKHMQLVSDWNQWQLVFCACLKDLCWLILIGVRSLIYIAPFQNLVATSATSLWLSFLLSCGEVAARLQAMLDGGFRIRTILWAQNYTIISTLKGALNISQNKLLVVNSLKTLQYLLTAKKAYTNSADIGLKKQSDQDPPCLLFWQFCEFQSWTEGEKCSKF